MSRQHLLVDRMVEQFCLDLSNLNVLTEAASGAYKLNPLIAAKAGAKVFCVAKDSRFGSKESIAQLLLDDAKKLGVEDNIEVIHSPFDAPLAKIDIVTNSGFVRPINHQMITQLKKTCVIPLMWETWEFRDCDFDLDCCKENDILCLGTNESEPPLDMDPYAGILALKMLFDLGLEVYKNKVAIIGENRFAWRVYNYLKQAGCDVHWFSKDSYKTDRDSIRVHEFHAFRDWFSEHGESTDAVLLADLVHKEAYTDTGAFLEPEFLQAINPFIRIGVLAGVVDTDPLLDCGITVYPERTMPAHFMSYQLYDIGPTPIMELFTAGLKVGQIMSSYRLQGLAPKEAVKASLQTSSLVMDFEGDLSWS